MKENEEFEEDFENYSLEREYEERYKKQIFYKSTDKPIKFISESENLINCLLVELTTKYYRHYIKYGFIKKQNKKFGEKKSLKDTTIVLKDDDDGKYKPHTKVSEQTVKKLDIIKGATSIQTKKNIDFLKHSLQEAGKLAPDKPMLEPYEKEMFLLNSKNSYLNSLFYLMMASFRSGKQDQLYLLMQATQEVEKAVEDENKKIEYYEDKFFYIKSFEKFNKNKKFNTSTFYPYNLLTKDIMIEKKTKIPEPVLIHKTQATATFIFPIYKLKKNNLEDIYKMTNRVCLFGQISTGTNIVALHNKNLAGTGSIFSAAEYRTTKNLKPNEKYIFAYAGYDHEDVIIDQIGATSKEIELYFSLPLNCIYHQISKVAYDYGHYEIAKKNSKIVFNYFTERTDLRDKLYDNKNLSVAFYKLKYDYVYRTCFYELESIIYCFYYFSKSMFELKKQDHLDDTALEIACYIQHYSLIKLLTREIYNSSESILKQKNIVSSMVQILIRCSMAINIIPQSLWDQNLRCLSSLLSYNIFFVLINNNELDVYKKVLIQEIGLPKRKFNSFPYKYMKKIDDGGKKKVEKDKKKEAEAEEEKLVLVTSNIIKEIEKENAELDETIISMYDYNGEIMRNKLNQALVSIERYSYLENIGPEIEKRKKEVNEIIDIWDGFKLEGAKYLQKYATTNRESEKYYEICDKLLKRTLETTKLPNIAENIKIMDDIVLKETDLNYLQKIHGQKLHFFSSDIVYKMKMRIKDFLDKVEKEIQAEKERLANEKKEITDIEVTVIVHELNLEQIRKKIEFQYFGTEIDDEKYVPYSSMSINEIAMLKEKYFWIGDILYNKAIIQFYEYILSHNAFLNYDFNNFFGYKLVDINKIQKFSEEDKVFINFREQPDKNPEVRLKMISKILEKLAYSSVFINEIQNYTSYDNLIYLSYNLLTYEMLCPNDTMNENIYVYLNMITDFAIERLTSLMNGTKAFQQTNYDDETKNLKYRLEDSNNIRENTVFNISKKNNNEEVKKVDREFLINHYKANLNFDAYVEFICFTIQCTFLAKKWNVLSDIITRFNSITNDVYCDFTLQYIIEAQRNLFEKANSNLNDKQLEMNQRVALFENWKNSKKKNKRQQMLTGEIPQEQIDFERDYNVLSKEHYILESISKLLKGDLVKSENQLRALINDSNNAVKAMASCRKLFEKYQMESIMLKKEEYNKGNEHFDVKSRNKAIKIFSSNIVKMYKNAVQILTKRQENYLLIQSLYELSLVYYSDGDIKNAEMYFSQALDTVFQMNYSLREFRNTFENTKCLGEKYGIRQLFYALVILHKLFKYCYDNDLYNQRESCLMAGQIVYYILTPYLPNPNNILNFSTFRLSEVNKNINIFESAENVKPADVVHSLIEITEVLISYGDYETCLPICCLAEYLACDICRHIPYLNKTRIQKMTCLAELGLINEAFQTYYKICKRLDLPNILPTTIYNDKTVGKYANLTKEFIYNNNQTPDYPKNLEAINQLMKLSVDYETKFSLGCHSYSELMFAKCSLIFKIYEKENYLTYLEKSDPRIEIFMRLDKDLRDTLLQVSVTEELNVLSYQLAKFKVQAPSRPEIDLLNRKIETILNEKKITSDELNQFYLLKLHKNEVDLRSERLDLSCKIRILLSRIFSAQCFYLGSCGTLMKGLENLKKYSSNIICGVETGEDYIFDIKANEDKNPKGGKNEKAPAKQDAKKGQVVVQPVTDEEINNLLVNLLNSDKRVHCNSQYWLRLQYLILNNYFKLNRYDDCIALIEKLSAQAKEVNDIFYFMRFKEMLIMINMIKFDTKMIHSLIDDITVISKTYFINDYEYSVFLANYAEFLYKSGSKELAILTIKEARKIIWNKLLKMNYMIKGQNFTENKYINDLDIDKQLKQILVERESTFSGVLDPKQKKPVDAKKKDEGTKEISQIEFGVVVPFNEKIENFKENINLEINNTDEGYNIYFKYSEYICRIDLKFLYFLIENQTSDQNLEIMQNIANDIEILSNKILYPHNSIKLQLYYIMGKIKKLIFVNDFKNFINDKILHPINLMKKNKLEVLRPENMRRISNYFNERCISHWIPNLLKSKDLMEKSIGLMKTEYYCLENGVTLSDILLDTADVCLLLADYRPSIEPKFCDYNQIVLKISSLYKKQCYYDKENDFLPHLNDDYLQEEEKNEKKNWINDKLKAENLLIKNFIKHAIYYSEIAFKIYNYKKLTVENIHDLGSASLIDPSKMPKDLINQISENDFLNKKKNKSYITNIQVKPFPDCFDAFNFLKSLSKEIEFLTFNNEESIKNLSKLHKYMKANSSNYSNKCYTEVLVSPEITDINAEIIKKDQIITTWIKENETSYLVYIFAPNSTVSQNSNIIFGKIPFSHNLRVTLNKKLFILRNELKYSMTLSEQKKKRDLKYWQMEYLKYIIEFSVEFLKPKDMYNDVKKIDSHISKELLGDVTQELLDFWINFTNNEVFTSTHQKFNAYLYDLHLKLNA